MLTFLQPSDLMRQFIMEAGFFIQKRDPDSIDGIINQIKKIHMYHKLFRTFIVFETMLYVKKKQDKPIKFYYQQNSSIDTLYKENPDVLYFSGDYYGGSKNNCPAMSAKCTIASDGIIIVLKYDHRLVDGGTLLYVFKSILNGNDVKEQTYIPLNQSVDWIDISKKIYNLKNMFSTTKGYSNTLYLNLSCDDLVGFKNSKNKYKNIRLSTFDIFIAILIKYYAQNYIKNTYLFSFFHDTRTKESLHFLGNHFLIVDVLLKRKNIINFNVHKLASEIKKQKSQIQIFPVNVVGTTDILFNPLIVSHSVKIKWPTQYKYYINHVFPKQVYVIDNGERIEAELPEDFYNNLSYNGWYESIKTYQNYSSKTQIKNTDEPIAVNWQSTIKEWIVEINGGQSDDYDEDEPLSLFGIDSVSMIHLIEKINTSCKVPLDEFIDEDTSIKSLITLINQNLLD